MLVAGKAGKYASGWADQHKTFSVFRGEKALFVQGKQTRPPAVPSIAKLEKALLARMSVSGVTEEGIAGIEENKS